MAGPEPLAQLQVLQNSGKSDVHVNSSGGKNIFMIRPTFSTSCSNSKIKVYQFSTIKMIIKNLVMISIKVREKDGETFQIQ